MTERPILFSAPMVLALLAGAKTQTRRIVKAEHLDCADVWAFDVERGLWESGEVHQGPTAHVEFVKCPYGVPGDRLWVKEAHALLLEWTMPDGLVSFAKRQPAGSKQRVAYRAGPFRAGEVEDDRKGIIGFDENNPVRVARWKPSIFMRRAASRISLEVTGVRVERLQEISEADASAEGVDCGAYYPASRLYSELWESINGAGSWAANPWVWVVEFKPCAPLEQVSR